MPRASAGEDTRHREQQIPGEVVGKRRVELQHLLQGVSFDDVEVAVGQSSDVSAGLSESHFLPENIPKYVSLTCRERKSIEPGTVNSPKMATTSSSWMTSRDPDTTKQRLSTLSPAW
ncbi:hypothetical protein EYF80_026054 [Liparis tanakae]|uniref:Uncharacterized protein n=1 Tax=Liparis tanakae TaxID=230148 RepID=A0A4Z2HCY3_9TELE|nr:hypothetical protein EYF80_026054 [Liparis tanakae]